MWRERDTGGGGKLLASVRASVHSEAASVLRCVCPTAGAAAEWARSFDRAFQLQQSLAANIRRRGFNNTGGSGNGDGDGGGGGGAGGVGGGDGGATRTSAVTYS